ncbi:molybdopterin-dependent oxidoreductase [Halalkalibacterium halodurans]|uniref:molybdopterin-dependent oxidoreductase n=1 Tax=Halalkalibacterium halodurans TaxID=86665 RepID=UPI002AA980E7|nr:molybdopterin-dependent oxidoreductase [Halalkalibacterium halodurans]MDY7223404.1 molybdopterin-dependent oxidoreductase [Halalkalibacterium halodurans]MDY7242625.1 molybdopterin-dependent oxidoreductase [Halalkalibacterium halodurans]
MATRKSVCPHNCPDTCGLIITTKNDQVISLHGDPQHPVTGGAICGKVRQHYREKVHGSHRVLTPLIRTGEKGSGAFKPISWERALSIIVDRFEAIIASANPTAILPYSYSGTIGIIQNGSMDRRFFHRLGAATLERTICAAAGTEAFRYTMGASVGLQPEETRFANLVIVWGSNLVVTNVHQWLYILEARKRGAKVIVIDVERTETARQADWFIQIKPGTDLELALGIQHVLIEEELINGSFIERQTVGFRELAAHVATYSLDRVERMTGINKEDIQRLARMYGTEKRSFIRIGNGQQHHHSGGMSTRAILSLPALTGAWEAKGGGAIYFNLKHGEYSSDILHRPDLRTNEERRVNMNELGKVLLSQQEPILALFVYISNPASVAPDQRKVLQGLARDDLFVVVHEQQLTDTAKFADIVLPATTFLEHDDVYRSYWHPYWQLGRRVISPIGQSKSNTELFRMLANAFHFQELCFRDNDETLMKQAIFGDSSVDSGVWEQFLSGKPIRWKPTHLSAQQIEPWKIGEYETPSGKIELYSEAMHEAGLPPLPEKIPYKQAAAPYQLIISPSRKGLNSQFIEYAKGKPVVQLSKEDAMREGIYDGDRVCLFNDHGQLTCTANVSEACQQGVIIARGVWWHHQHEQQGNFNTLTGGDLSDFGGGATFFSTYVQVKKSEA